MGKAEHFVIAGAQRCGTTYLSRVLGSHPDITMARPERPEPKYFLREPARSLDADNYRSECFGSPPTTQVLGEKSTSYLEFEHVAVRLRTVLPDVRVVVIVRDPVERAVSHVRFSQDNGFEPRSLDAALAPDATHPPWDPNATSVDPYAYRERGRYVDFLERYLCHLPREQMYVVVLEEFLASREPIDGLLAFLGLRHRYLQRPSKPVNRSVSTGRLSAERRDELVDYYDEPNRRLETLLGRPLSQWPQP